MSDPQSDFVAKSGGPEGGEGMTRGARHAVIFLFILALVLAGANLLFTSHEVNAVAAASQRAAIASQRAAAAAAAEVAQCRAVNIGSAKQVSVWEFIIHISKPPTTAQGRMVLAEFEHHLRVVFAPRNCTLPRTGG